MVPQPGSLSLTPITGKQRQTLLPTAPLQLHQPVHHQFILPSEHLPGLSYFLLQLFHPLLRFPNQLQRYISLFSHALHTLHLSSELVHLRLKTLHLSHSPEHFTFSHRTGTLRHLHLIPSNLRGELHPGTVGGFPT